MTKRKNILKIIGVLLIAFTIYFVWEIHMPTPNVDNSIQPSSYKRVEVSKDHYTVGKNWLKKNKYGIWEMYIEGEAYERGVIYGVLSKELMELQEDYFVAQINEIIPNRFFLFFLKMFVAWFNKDLDYYIPTENFKEIYGASLSFSDKYNYVGPKFYRILNYHAAHDIGHALSDLAMVGCTSFAVNKEFSTDSSLLIARNFDFYMGDDFAKDKLLLFVNPNKGYKFASYSWAGLTGVASGMNEKGLTITLNASKSDIPRGAKDPITLLAREILQYAKNIDEAIAIAKKREIFVSESLLIGSAEDDNAVIIEKSPSKLDVYYSKNNTLTCANHYQSPKFITDSINIKNIINSDSKARFDRMNELLQEKTPIDIQKATSILRDKNGANNEFIGYGNSKSLNQLIAHHGIIFKPSQHKMWISAPPYQIGNFVCYDLEKVFNEQTMAIDSLTIPKDSFLFSQEYLKYESYKTLKQQISKFVMLGIPLEIDLEKEKEFILNNPKNYTTYLVLGDYFYEKEEFKKSLSYYQKSLTFEVSSKEEIFAIKSKITKCKEFI